MKHNGLPLRRKISIAQKDSGKLVDQLVLSVFHVRRLSLKCQYQASEIIATDKKLVWSGMVSGTTVNTTGINTVTVKSTVYEKSRVSV